MKLLKKLNNLSIEHAISLFYKKHKLYINSFLIVTALTFCSLFLKLTHVIINGDEIDVIESNVASWQLRIRGKWAFYIIAKFLLNNTVYIHFLSPLLSIISLSFTGVCVSYFLKIKNRIYILISSLLLSTSPVFTSVTWWDNTFIQLLSLPCALLALIMINNKKSKVIKYFTSVLFLTFSIGLYKSSVMLFFSCTLLSAIINYKNLKSCLKEHLSHAIVLVISYGLNGLITKISFQLTGIAPTSFAASINIVSLTNAIHNLSALDEWYNYYFSMGNLYLTQQYKIVHTLLIIASIFSILTIRDSVVKFSIALISFLSIFLIHITTNLDEPQIRIAFSLPIFTILLFLVGTNVRNSNLIKNCTVILSVVILVMNFIWTNLFFSAIIQKNQSELRIAQIVASEIIGLPNYIPSNNNYLLIAGLPPNDTPSYPINDRLMNWWTLWNVGKHDILKLFGVKYKNHPFLKIRGNKITIKSNIENIKNLNSKEIIEQNLKKMNSFPHSGFVKIIGDVILVKF